MVTEPLDVDLHGLRIWVDRIAADYARLHPTAITAAARTVAVRQAREAALRSLDANRRSNLAVLRNTVAAGAVRYRFAGPHLTGRALPEALMLDFVTEILWPLLHTADLPESWPEDLAFLTSPGVSRLVVKARQSLSDGNRIDRQSFQLALARRPIAVGILNALEDLNDPRRGASYLAAAAARTSPPPKGKPTRELLAWVLGAATAVASHAVAGVVGNRTDALVLQVWDWLTASSMPHLVDSATSPLDAAVDDASRPRATSGPGPIDGPRSTGAYDVLDWLP
ncbi:MAG TPA: hypothetical protein VGD67_19865 [Pseudonocardiaceae bacterium]